MSLMRFDPLGEVMSLRDAMNRFFEEGFTRPNALTGPGQMMPMDMYETDNDVIVKMAMPGVKPDDVDITISGDTLTVRGHMTSDVENQDAQHWDWYRHELVHGQFMRSVTLPTRVDSDKAEASFENGILTLRLPKSEEVRPKRVSVQSRSHERQLPVNEGGHSQTGPMSHGGTMHGQSMHAETTQGPTLQSETMHGQSGQGETGHNHEGRA